MTSKPVARSADIPLLKALQCTFEKRFGHPPEVAAYAPGRVEVLGNHTDYNDGFVLSAAINMGTCFLVAGGEGPRCRLLADDVGEEVSFDASAPKPSADHPWSNYVKGVLAGLGRHARIPFGFDATFRGDIPLGAGLSSSAALEMSAGLAFADLYGIDIAPRELARIGQAAERDFAGANVGLLDQLSSLFGKDNALIMTDFRSLDITHVPLGADACFLMCNTSVKHSLVDSEYNERRACCEQAAHAFNDILPRPIHALRDVTWEEWERHSGRMDPAVARRAAHVIGENARVLRGRELLEAGKLDAFGALMFQSHESSRLNFENSCAELDILVNAAHRIPGALGARLSGGGFGGSAVVLVHPRDAEVIGQALREAYRQETGETCDVRTIIPSCGARLLTDSISRDAASHA